MSDLISRSAVLDELRKLTDMEEYGNSVSDIGFGLTMAVNRVRIAPAVDAVPVVRCRDCIHAEPMPDIGVARFGKDALNCSVCRGDSGFGYTGVSFVHPDDYCSDGALKDGEAHD